MPNVGQDQQSNPVTFCSQRITSLRGTLFTNNRAGTVAVVTFVGLVNITGFTDDQIAICRNLGTTTEAAFWSGRVGQGTLNRFPLICEVALLVGESLGWFLGAGNWDIVATGYFCPAVITSAIVLPAESESADLLLGRDV